jgi:hypothetical protein
VKLVEDDLYQINSEPFLEKGNIWSSLLRPVDKETQYFRKVFKRDSWDQLVPRSVSNATFFSEKRAKSILKSSKLYIHSAQGEKS